MRNLIFKTAVICCIFIFTKCKNKNATETNFCEKIHRDSSITLSNQFFDIRDSLKNKTGVYILEEGANSMITRAWLTEYAEKTIDIQYFIFSLDNIGLIACDYLIRAADRGVKIRILIDDIMVDADIKDILTMNNHPNISIKVYNPGVNLGKNIFQIINQFATNFRSANQRMHNKTFTVDNNTTITGGRNIADEYFDYDHQYNFRDRDVLLIGKDVKQVENSFNKFWNDTISVDIKHLTDKKGDTSISRFDKLHEYACNPLNFWPEVREKIKHLPKDFTSIKKSGKLIWLDTILFISDNPGKNDGTKGLKGGGKTTDALIELVRNANESITIQTPYLITTPLSENLFLNSIKKGVNIKILTNSLASTDNTEAFSSYQSKRKKLLDIGVEIYEFRPDAAERKKIMTGELHKKSSKQPIFGLHAKSMVIDREITVIGTFNLDPRSANLNTECITIIKSSKIANGVLEGMNIEFLPENSWKITENFNPDNLVSKYKQIKTWSKKIIPDNIL